MATNGKGTTKNGAKKIVTTPKASAGTPEALPSVTYADGALNSTLVPNLRGQYSLIELFNDKETVLIHSDAKDAPVVKIGKAAQLIITALVLAGTSGRSMATDGAMLWMGTTTVKNSRTLAGLVKGWSVRIDPTGQGGADRYEVPVATLNQIAQLRASFITPSVERFPARRSVREATERAVEQVDRLFY